MYIAPPWHAIVHGMSVHRRSPTAPPLTAKLTRPASADVRHASNLIVNFTGTNKTLSVAVPEYTPDGPDQHTGGGGRGGDGGAAGGGGDGGGGGGAAGGGGDGGGGGGAAGSGGDGGDGGAGGGGFGGGGIDVSNAGGGDDNDGDTWTDANSSCRVGERMIAGMRACTRPRPRALHSQGRGRGSQQQL